jgi:phage FluMu protein Com
MSGELTDRVDEAFDKLHEEFRSLFYQHLHTYPDIEPGLFVYAMLAAIQTVLMDIECDKCRTKMFKQVGEEFPTMLRDAQKDAERGWCASQALCSNHLH